MLHHVLVINALQKFGSWLNSDLLSFFLGLQITDFIRLLPWSSYIHLQLEKIAFFFFFWIKRWREFTLCHMFSPQSWLTMSPLWQSLSCAGKTSEVNLKFLSENCECLDLRFPGWLWGAHKALEYFHRWVYPPEKFQLDSSGVVKRREVNRSRFSHKAKY